MYVAASPFRARYTRVDEHQVKRQVAPRTYTSCMALPSNVNGATTISAPPKPSKDLSVPADLVPVSDLLTVPGGKGRAIELRAGQFFKVTNTYGEQVSMQLPRPISRRAADIVQSLMLYFLLLGAWHDACVALCVHL